jgi:hypothetical protein
VPAHDQPAIAQAHKAMNRLQKNRNLGRSTRVRDDAGKQREQEDRDIGGRLHQGRGGRVVDTLAISQAEAKVWVQVPRFDIRLAIQRWR